MAAKNDRSGAASLARLKKELAAGVIGRFYLFYGEEAYLREHYIGQIKKRLVADDENNFCCLTGKACTPKALTEAVESFPLFAERKLCSCAITTSSAPTRRWPPRPSRCCRRCRIPSA